MSNGSIPKFLYGTAWKENATADLVVKAINSGFRAIDTANQKKHYREDFVGDALLTLSKQGIDRKSLFLQSSIGEAITGDPRVHLQNIKRLAFRARCLGL